MGAPGEFDGRWCSEPAASVGQSEKQLNLETLNHLMYSTLPQTQLLLHTEISCTDLVIQIFMFQQQQIFKQNTLLSLKLDWYLFLKI